MIELGIQVKLSARKLTPDEAAKKISKVRNCLKVAAAFFSAVGIFDTINFLYLDPEIVPDPAKWHDIVSITIFPCELFVTSISLASAYLYLSTNIEQHFAKELQGEGKKIKGIFVFFSLSYISRAVVNLLVSIKVIKHGYAVFNTMYFFWDVLPLSSIMIYHLRTFRAEERERKKPPVDWTRQSSATDCASKNDSEGQSETQAVPKFEPTPFSASLLINSGDLEC